MTAFILYVACTAAIIGGINDKNKPQGYVHWALLDNHCTVERNNHTIEIKCKDGELFYLPTNQCAVSRIKKP